MVRRFVRLIKFYRRRISLSMMSITELYFEYSVDRYARAHSLPGI